MRKSWFLVSSALSTATACLASGPAWGQSSPDQATTASETTDEREIVVTATGRAERTLDVPYNITAIEGGDLAKNRVLDSAEMLRGIPGVSLPDKGPRNASVVNQVVMRGINVDGAAFGDYSVSTVSPVSTYVNNTPLFASFQLRDINRVEVLRGPQGTLYGSGAMGGTLRYILNDPRLEETSLYARVGASWVDGSSSIGFDGDIVANLPLGDTLALRVAASRLDLPGVIDLPNAYKRDASGVPVAPGGNILSPDPVFEHLEDVDFYKSTYLRASLRWQPSPVFNFVLSETYQSDESGGRRAQTVGVNGYGTPYKRYELGTVQREPYTRDVSLTSLEATVDLGFATLTSTTSYYDNHGFSNSENSGFYTHINNDVGYWGYYFYYPRPEAAANRRFGDEAWTQEVRLASNNGKVIDYVVGLYYQRQKLLSTQDSFLTGFVQWCNVSPSCLYRPYVFADGSDFHYRRDETFTDKAAFGEVTLHLGSNFDLTGGLRVFKNKDENRTEQFVGVYSFFRVPAVRERTMSDSKVLYKVNAAWRYADDQLIYATVSKGYRRGGINAVPTSGFLPENPVWEPYRPDFVTNFELGTKGRLFGNLSYDADIFYIDWKDAQYNTATTMGYFATVNAGKAKSYGFEFALDGKLGSATHFTLGYAYTNAELAEDAMSPVGVVQAFKGDRLPTIPRHMLTGSLDHSIALGGDTSLYLRGAGFYQSDIRNALGYTPPRVPVARFNTRLPGFAIFNLSATLFHSGFDFTVYAKNIFNEEGVTAEFTNAYMGNSSRPQIDHYYGNGSKQYLSQPRTLGISIGKRF